MEESIQEIYQRIKAFLAEDVYFYTFLIITISIISFGLGRWSVQDVIFTKQSQVQLINQPAVTILSETEPTLGSSEIAGNQRFVVSKKGSKYHLVTCPGAKQMNEENKIYFTSEEEAKALGYTPAANCKF